MAVAVVEIVVVVFVVESMGFVDLIGQQMNFSMVVPRWVLGFSMVVVVVVNWLRLVSVTIAVVLLYYRWSVDLPL